MSGILYYCSWPACPGYGWPASERPHPPSCSGFPGKEAEDRGGYPMGHPVRFWPVWPPYRGQRPRYVDTKTRDKPFKVGGGILVQPIVGFNGGVSVAHLQDLDELQDPERLRLGERGLAREDPQGPPAPEKEGG